jgi:hypothetical protein
MPLRDPDQLPDRAVSQLVTAPIYALSQLTEQ